MTRFAVTRRPEWRMRGKATYTRYGSATAPGIYPDGITSQVCDLASVPVLELAVIFVVALDSGTIKKQSDFLNCMSDVR